MKMIAIYLAFVIGCSLLGMPWFKAAAFPWLTGFAYILFATLIRPSPGDTTARSLCFAVALLVGVLWAANYGTPDRAPIEDLRPVSEDR